MASKGKQAEFPGFHYWDSRKQFLKYPMILQEYWWQLSGSEQKVLDFIIRQTFGWKKQSDTLSISQFTDGVKKNRGTGLSASQVKRAIDSLEAKGFIEVKRRNRRPSVFTLRVSEEAKQQRKLEIHYLSNLPKPKERLRFSI